MLITRVLPYRRPATFCSDAFDLRREYYTSEHRRRRSDGNCKMRGGFMRRMLLASMLIAAGLATAHAADSDSVVVGGFDFGFKTMHLDPRNGGNVLDTSYVSVNPSVAWGYKSFYASLSYDRSIAADPTIGQTTGATPSATWSDFSRTESTFTLGYRLNDAVSLFTGYTKGANHFTQMGAALVLVATEIDYTETGPFVGVAFNVNVRDKGNLGLSVGYAKLDAKLQIVAHPGGATTEVTGDSTGLSYALTWSGTLTGSLGYRVGAKSTSYDMDDPGQVTERFNSIFLGITNYF